MALAQPVRSYRIGCLGGGRLLAALASEIMQCASDRYHLVHHSPSPVAKVISQNSQPPDRSQRGLHWDPPACQQSIDPPMAPVQAPFIGGDHTGGHRLQPFESAVCQNMAVLAARGPGFAQTYSEFLKFVHRQASRGSHQSSRAFGVLQ